LQAQTRLYNPFHLQLLALFRAVQQIKINQLLVCNSCFRRQPFEIIHHFRTQIDPDCLFLARVRILNSFNLEKLYPLFIRSPFLLARLPGRNYPDQLIGILGPCYADFFSFADPMRCAPPSTLDAFFIRPCWISTFAGMPNLACSARIIWIDNGRFPRSTS
jgi:hypothetical protein